MAFRGRPQLAFQKPENALKRSQELIAVGQSHAALQALHDVITSKRHRTWQKILETIMFKYVDLCVELKKGRYAKDGLIHYRNVCQQVNVASLEEVIKYFIKTATDRAEAATASAESVDLNVQDLDEAASPEDLMLGFVSSEKGKDRTDRELVTPWFKFLWETYRTTLDILRNNSRLESLYAMTAGKAFQFCFTYKRTTEFRRLCDTLRNHLANLNKYREQRDRPDLTNPETLQLYLETRFDQLKTACDLELWQEAFRSVEDIQGLMTLGKKAPKPQLMATYYARLTRIFMVSGSHLYNGYAWYKLFSLAKGYNKNLTQGDVSGMASCVLLAGLAIPPYDRAASAITDAQAELERERSTRMASILGFSTDAKRGSQSVLSRSSLLAELQAKGVLNIIPQEVKDIYALLETDFNPLELCAKLAPLLEKLPGLDAQLSPAAPVAAAELGLYRPALQRVAITKMLHQLSQVYSVLKLDKLAKLVPFASLSEIETIIVDAILHGYLAVRLDHRAGTLRFGAPGLDSARMRDHIAVMARRLSTAQRMIQPDADPALEQRRLQMAAAAAESAKRDNQRALARKVVIEERKEKAERAALAAEQEDADRRLMQQRINDAVEEQRRKDEMLKRETERLKREIEQREMEEALALVKQTKGKGGKLKEGVKLNKEELMREAFQEQMKERQDMEKKLQTQARRADHLERARREEEAPLLLAAHQQRLQDDEVRWKAAQEAKAKQHRAEWEQAVAEKQRLARMRSEEASFRATIMGRRQELFEQLAAEREDRIAEKKAMLKQDREFNRKKEYARRCRVKVEEMRRAAEEAELARVAEQEAREEAERQRKMQEAAAKQRAREEEIEAKAAEQRAKLMAEADRPRPSADDGPKIGAAFQPAARRPGAFVPSAARRTSDGAPTAAASEDREWGRREPPPPARDAAPAARGGGWRPSRPRSDAAPPSARDEAPPPRPSVGDGGGGGKWVPSARRGAGDEARSSSFGPSRRDAEGPPRREDGPPPARGDRWAPSRARDGDRNRAQPPAPRAGGSGW